MRRTYNRPRQTDIYKLAVQEASKLAVHKTVAAWLDTNQHFSSEAPAVCGVVAAALKNVPVAVPTDPLNQPGEHITVKGILDAITNPQRRARAERVVGRDVNMATKVLQGFETLHQ